MSRQGLAWVQAAELSSEGGRIVMHVSVERNPDGWQPTVAPNVSDFPADLRLALLDWLTR